MADVIHDRRTAADRAQMILVAAFGVAVMLVALALILNTSIYTENIATRGSDISGGKDALQYRATTEAMLTGTVRKVNEDHATTAYADYRTPAVEAVWDYENLSGGHNARSSVVTNVTEIRTSDWEGAHVYQPDPAGNFTNQSDTGNWTVATDVTGVRDVSMNVSKNSLRSSTSGSVDAIGNDYYHLTFESASETYRVFVYNNSSETNSVDVLVEDGTDREVCTRTYGSYAGQQRAVINLTNASVEGDHCSALEMWHPVVDDPFDVHQNNTCDTGLTALLGDYECTSTYYIRGSYTMVLNESYGAVNVQPGTTDPQPYLTSALYSMRVHVVYESGRLYMETDVRVAPGEPDA